MSAVKLVCGLHRSPRYIAHLVTTAPRGQLALTHMPSRTGQGMKHRGTYRVRPLLSGRLYELTCCQGPLRLTDESARILLDVGERAENNTVDLPAFLKTLPYYRN